MKINSSFFLAIAVFLVLLITIGGRVMALELRSTEFKEGEYIPQQYTGEGPDISPALSWSGAPEQTKGFALICDDPDAPMGTWVHWVIYDVPAEVNELASEIPNEGILADGSKQGKNDFGTVGYGGPMPPAGKPHRYFFKLYALDEKLDLAPGLSKDELVKAIKAHVLAEAQLMGLYKR